MFEHRNGNGNGDGASSGDGHAPESGSHPTEAPLPAKPAKAGSQSLAIQDLNPSQQAHWIHGYELAANVYRHVSSKIFSPETRAAWEDSANRYAKDMLHKLTRQSLDPIEEMLSGQLLLLDARVKHLAVIAATRTDPDEIARMQQALDSAANSFRRAVLAMVEYRRPPAQRIAQQNNAHQMVVTQNLTNELGSCKREESVPPDPKRLDRAHRKRPADAAVGKVDRAANASGQGTIPDERREARPAVGAGGRAAAADGGDQADDPRKE